MWPKLIRTKVITCIAATLTLGGGAIIGLAHREYTNQVDRIGRQSLDQAREAFRSAEADDVKMMSATLDTLLADQQITARFASRDRAGLLELTAPLLTRLKASYGITNWMFIEPEPSNQVFLRVHQPAVAGDVMKRPLHDQAIRTKTFAVGTELGKAGFILRVVHPMYDPAGRLVGYTNLGEEIGGFIGRVRQQTGHEVAIIMKKDLLDPKLWDATCKALHRDNTWDAWPRFVLMGSTKKEVAFADFGGDLESIPEGGQVLGLQTVDGHAFLRVVIPIVDDQKRRSGGIILENDITDVYLHARMTAMFTIGVILCLVVFMSLAIAFMMDRLVFRRLDRVIDKTERFVGGDADSAITVEGDDEVGRIETLLDQLRQLFAHTTAGMSDRE